MNKKNILLYFVIVLFGAVGIYLTFFVGNTSKYDSKIKAYRIDVNESLDSDGDTMYYPTYYFEVNGKEYECKSKSGSSSVPNESKNTVYYDSTNPNKCVTEYEQSTSKFMGIIFLVVTAVIIFLTVKKPSQNINGKEYVEEIDMERQQQIEENVQKVMNVVGKVNLIYKRVIIGIIFVIFLVFILVDFAIVKQTIKAKDYIETIAVYESKKDVSESEIFDDYIYTFNDKKGNKQRVTVSISKDDSPEEEMRLKYNENNPQDYYEESALMSKSGIIWFIVKVVIEVLLILLFFNKKLLSRISISSRMS